MFFYSFLFNNDYSVICPLSAGSEENGRMDDLANVFSGAILWINIFSSVLLVPVYEEIVFRGCLFNSFKFWFNDNIYISAIVTSVIFSALHLQYTDFRTF